jgi:hypothetical protein
MALTGRVALSVSNSAIGTERLCQPAGIISAIEG